MIRVYLIPYWERSEYQKRVPIVSFPKMILVWDLVWMGVQEKKKGGTGCPKINIQSVLVAS